MGEKRNFFLSNQKKLNFNSSIGPSAKISKYHHNGIQISFFFISPLLSLYKSAVCLLFFVCLFIVFLKSTIFSFFSFKDSFFSFFQFFDLLCSELFCPSFRPSAIC